MRRRRIIWAGLALVILGVAGWIAFGDKAPPEPVYQGRKLSVWIEATASPNRRESDEANAALHDIGSKAVPFLLYQLEKKSLEWHRHDKFAKALKKMHIAHDPFVPGLAQTIMATVAVGPPALPGLEKLLEKSTNEEVLRDGYCAVYLIANGTTNQVTLSPATWKKLKSVVPPPLL